MNSFKALGLVLFTFIVVFNFSSCKKGEDDPFISWKSRNARIAGTWVFTNGVGTMSQTLVGYINEDNDIDSVGSLAFDGSIQTTTWTVNDDPPEIENIERSTSITFNKDGSYDFEDKTVKTVEITVITPNQTIITTTDISETGNWNFTGKVGDEKKKESIVLTPTDNTTAITIELRVEGKQPEIETSTVTNVISTSQSETWHLRELRTKQLVIETTDNRITTFVVEEFDPKFNDYKDVTLTRTVVNEVTWILGR
ncbi:MAG: hypothetical protein IH946_08525 [Bacteroidetes bacterium]|nr:hypothetical protein [Bacteroidota bacterium]